MPTKFVEIREVTSEPTESPSAAPTAPTTTPITTTTAPESSAAPPTTAPPMPTLSPTSVSGSECASSTTEVQCVGAGGGCLTQTKCTTWTATPAPLAVNKKFCYPESRWPGHLPISDEQQQRYSDEACDWFDGVTLREGTAGVKSYTNRTADGPPYWFMVGWLEGCTLEGGFTDQTLDQPIPGLSEVTCRSIMRDDYKGCKLTPFSMLLGGYCCRSQADTFPFYLGNNGGVGGYTVAGCIFYVFNICDYFTDFYCTELS